MTTPPVKKHMKKFVSCDPDKCVGCSVCEYACAWEKEKVFNPLKSRIRAIRIGQVVNMAVTCRLCENPPCVVACPVNALEQSEETGTILVDEDKCNGCGWCIEACDYGAITLHPDKRKVIVCDTCKGDPKCVEWCPEDALDFVTTDIVAQKARISAVKNLIREATATT